MKQFTSKELHGANWQSIKEQANRKIHIWKMNRILFN